MSAPAKSDAGALPDFIRPNFERMPPELKQLNNWVLWVPEWTGSKWTKRPVQPSGFAASTTNPEHRSSFDDVKQAYEHAVARGYIEVREKNKPPHKVTIGGVGFVFDGQPDENGLVFAGVDFDGVITRQAKVEIASFAAERVKRIGSYFEVSVSRTGLHVILKARPLASGIAHNGIELYTSGRFFTMTGHSGDPKPIIAAPDAFEALADELRAQSKTSRNQNGNLPAQVPPESAASDAADSWLSRLPLEKQSEVVKYAAVHIADNSTLFELTEHGGNYQEYLKLTFAIARSGVPDAEDIFVEAALKAKGADSEEDLRNFFQNCKDADPRVDGVTVGTLFHQARQSGANFDQWKRLADGRSSNIALFVPGNEENCRKLLDRVVAADPRTYTFGDPAGPLVILRVPDQDALPPETKWEGDLPGTTLAMPADIMQRAELIQWKRRSKGGLLVPAHPPRAFIGDYLIQRRGRYGARPLRGVVRVPRIDDTGNIHFVSGYDPETGLFHDRVPKFDVLPRPSRDDASNGAKALLLPFSKYKFEDDKAGRALVLAAIFTAIERPFLPVAPMFVVRSSMPGTGKGLIVRSLVRLAFDTVPVVVTWGGNSEEFEKRLGALLLQAPGALCIDNANGMQVKGDLLEAFITEGAANIRPLGRSETVKVRSRSFITLTGNNPIITGDMARRALSLDILPRSADPERDRYNFNPVDGVERHRTDLLRAAFTVMRAFRQAGMPSQGLSAVGSFDDWSRVVRDLVYWLTDFDVSEGFRQNKAEDPRRQGDASLLAALNRHYSTAPFKAADVIALHGRVRAARGSYYHVAPTPEEQAVHDALEDVLGKREINAKLLGYWARRVKGAYIDGFILNTDHDAATNANLITVRQT
jgi:putative DNA primase/helicase